MAKKADSSAITVQAGDCPKCGKHNIKAKYFQTEDKRIMQTITCNDCGYSVSETEDNRYRAAKAALTVWGYSEGYGPKNKKIATKPIAKEEKKEESLHKVEEEVKNIDVCNIEKTDGRKVNFKPRSEAQKQFTDTLKPSSFTKKKKSKDTEALDEKRVALPKEKTSLLKELKNVIANFVKNNPKEDCPVTLGDLMKVFGFTNEEIASELSTPKYKKKFLKSKQEVLYYLNKGESVYTRDKEGTTFKYTPVQKLEDNQYTIQMFDAIGFTNYAYIIVNN